MTPKRGVFDKLPLNDERSWVLLRRLLREAVRPYKLVLAFAVVAMTVAAGTQALIAWLMDPVVNEVFVEQNQAMLWLVGGAVLATFLVKSIASYAQEALMAYVGHRVVADTQRRLFARLLDQDVSLFQAHQPGTLLSRFSYDVERMRAAVSNALVNLGRDTLTVIFLVGVMFYQQWMLASIALVVAPATVLPIHHLGQRMRQVTAHTQHQMGQLTTTLSQSFHGIRMVKAYRMEAYERDKANNLVETIFGLAFRAARVRAAASPIVDVFGGIAATAIVVYGGHRVVQGATTPGAFFSFLTALMLAYQPMRALSKVNAIIQEGLASAERVFNLVDREPRIQEPENPSPVPYEAGPVRFDGVRFSYDDEADALAGVTFEAPAGRTTALVGPSGAGKSTVLNLIPRFYDPREGTVSVNGVDVRDASLADLRDHMALVSQEVTLFDDTVANNIRFGRPDADAAAVREAARAAAAEQFIDELPHGFDTTVGEHGLKLSGGQRQRLAIARAVLKDAPILLLDEATSALDTESERQIQAALERLMAGRTTIVIAHRLSTVMHADVIHVFETGEVVESGPHDTLLAHDGLYARLYALQFAAEQPRQAVGL